MSSRSNRSYSLCAVKIEAVGSTYLNGLHTVSRRAGGPSALLYSRTDYMWHVQGQTAQGAKSQGGSEAQAHLFAFSYCVNIVPLTAVFCTFSQQTTPTPQHYRVSNICPKTHFLEISNTQGGGPGPGPSVPACPLSSNGAGNKC